MLEESMRTVSDVERFLEENGVRFQGLGDGMFIVADENSGLRNLAIKVEDALVVFNLRVMDVPAPGTNSRESLFESLLRLNASGLLHAAFSLQDDGIYLQAALPLDNLDSNEMQAVLDDMGMAASQHIPRLLNKNAN
jgi:hypothetical protein